MSRTLSIILVLLIMSCAHKPSIIKETKDCVTFKTSGVKGYLCFDKIGGNAKVK